MNDAYRAEVDSWGVPELRMLLDAHEIHYEVKHGMMADHYRSYLLEVVDRERSRPTGKFYEGPVCRDCMRRVIEGRCGCTQEIPCQNSAKA